MIITANGPSASQEFAETVVAALQASVRSDSISDQIENPETEAVTSANVASQSAAWRCNECGYIYDPAKNDGLAFEDLPATWKCPCGAPRGMFVRI